MPSWWPKSSKEGKKKTSKESFIDTLHRKFRIHSEGKVDGSGGSRRRCSDALSEKKSQSQLPSRSSSPSKLVARCQSFTERPIAQPLPLPGLQPANVGHGSEISISPRPRLETGSKSSFLPLPRPRCSRNRSNTIELDGDLVTASVSSESSNDFDDPDDPSHHSPQANDYDNGTRIACSPSRSVMFKDHSTTVPQITSREAKKSTDISFINHISPAPPKQRPLSSHVPNLLVPYHGASYSAPDSSLSSPSRSPLRGYGVEQGMNCTFWSTKPYPDVTLLGSGQCSSPGSGQNSGHNPMGGDNSGQLFWQHSRGSPEYSPVPSPRMISPEPSSRIQSGAVTPIHPRAGGMPSESPTTWPDDGKQQSHRLPLPPVSISNSSPFSHSNSASTSPSVPRSPGRAENPASLGSHWKKGKLVGRGTFGHVYIGFNSESGEMCAMKEVTLFSDDAKSRESAKQLMQEISLLSRLQHPNIVQYYGSETVDDKLYIYLEYVSGGSIFKLLQDYGQFGEQAIRNYTQQILSGLAYLHAKNTVHRDIKGANILVDPNGRVKLADFGTAKHINGQSGPLSFKGSPYWMAPEVIKNSSGCSLAVDVWSLGCTVLEMATSKPPWSQYEGPAAMFKIGNSKEVPAIPGHLSEDGKDFIRQCLQRNPLHRPTASQLLEHPFVKYAPPLERAVHGSEPSHPTNCVIDGAKSMGYGPSRNISTFDPERLAVHSSRVSKVGAHTSGIHIPRNISCPVSPIGSPLLHSRSPQHLNGRMSSSPISSPRTTSGSSTSLTSGSGVYPYNQLKQSVYLQDCLMGMPKSPNGLYANGSLYNNSKPDIFGAMQASLQQFSDLVPCENDALGKQFGRAAHGKLYDGQSVLADRVSRQLMRDHAKTNSSLDLSPNSSLPSHANGI